MAAPAATPEPRQAAVQLADVHGEAQESSLRERRLRYLLLLASRLALLLLLVLAFAKPVWERPPAVVAGRIASLHLVVLDTSLSMSYGDRWQRAVAAANGIVDGMQGGDRAQIIATGPGVQVLTPDLGR